MPSPFSLLYPFSGNFFSETGVSNNTLSIITRDSLAPIVLNEGWRTEPKVTFRKHGGLF